MKYWTDMIADSTADEIKSYLKNGLQNISSSLDLEIYISTACLTLWEIGLLDVLFCKTA